MVKNLTMLLVKPSDRMGHTNCDLLCETASQANKSSMKTHVRFG